MLRLFIIKIISKRLKFQFVIFTSLLFTFLKLYLKKRQIGFNVDSIRLDSDALSASQNIFFY